MVYSGIDNIIDAPREIGHPVFTGRISPHGPGRKWNSSSSRRSRVNVRGCIGHDTIRSFTAPNEMLGHAESLISSSSMPELPDITVYVEALERRLIGERLDGVRIQSPFLLRTFDPPFDSVNGKAVREIRRLGKTDRPGVRRRPLARAAFDDRRPASLEGARRQARHERRPWRSSLSQAAHCCSPRPAPSTARRSTWFGARWVCASTIRGASSRSRRQWKSFKASIAPRENHTLKRALPIRVSSAASATHTPMRSCIARGCRRWRFAKAVHRRVGTTVCGHA